MTRGLFITFEGGEGTGKSTQVTRLAESIASRGQQVILTREPGGTALAEAIRDLLVRGDDKAWTPQAEVLLNYAARDSHLNEIIRPGLEAGRTVISDRFSDSTRVYQGIAGGIDQDLIEMLDRTVVGSTLPDLTFVLDIDPTEGLARAAARATPEENRFERKSLAFHRKVRDGFIAMTQRFPERCHLIDAAGDVDAIATEIWEMFAMRLAT